MYFITDWTQRVDFDLIRRERWQRTRDMMAAKGLAGLVLFKYQNIRYVSGMRPLYFPIPRLANATVCSPEYDAPIVLVTGGDVDHRRATMRWIPPENVRVLPPLEDPTGLKRGFPILKAALEELGMTHGDIGLDIASIPLLNALTAAFPNIRIVDGDEPVVDLKVIKSEEEIQAFRASCIAVELAFQRAIEAVRVGARECEILGEGMKALYSYGMEIPQCSSIVSSGDNLAPIARFGSDRPVRYGDLVFMDMGGCFNGMFAEFTRTVACEEASSEQRRIGAAVYDAMVSAVRAMRPGSTSADVEEATDAAFRRHRLEGFALGAALGHSIGTGGLEPPMLGDSRAAGTVFELRPNMVFSVEPTIIVPGVPGGGGIRIEDEILITENGPEVLTKTPLDDRLFPSRRLEL